MPIRPRLVRSIPFWALVVVSVATAAAGALLLLDTLGSMTTTLTDGSAAGVDVYVGQSVAVLGAVLVGAGVLGLLLALTIATAAGLRPVAPVEVVGPIEWADEVPADRPAVQVEAFERSDADLEPAISR